VGDWPIKEYLKRHFSNQRNYNNRIQRKAREEQAEAKKRGEVMWEDLNDFGTDKENDDDGA